MKENEHNTIETEDIDYLLIKVEDSFDIKFADYELNHIKTFGELCDHIENRIQFDNSEDCTSQQAFYKLKKSIEESLNYDSKKLKPETLVSEFLPRKGRRKRTKLLEKSLGFRISILRPPKFLTTFLITLMLISFIGLFFIALFGVLGIIFTIVSLKLANKFGKELDVTTVRELVEKMKSESYFKSRRNPKTINKSEIENVLKELFCEVLGIEKSTLTRDARFV